MTTEDARRHLAEGERLLERFTVDGSVLQKDWSSPNWQRINDTTEQFCSAMQLLNMSVGGMHRRVFDKATTLLTTFVERADDLLSDASNSNSLPPDAILQNILGVIERSKLRIQELCRKRDDIKVFKKKIAEIMDP